MKKNKKILIFLLIIILSLVSCSKNDTIKSISIELTNNNSLVKPETIFEVTDKDPVLTDTLDDQIIYFMMSKDNFANSNFIFKDKEIDIMSYNLKTKETINLNKVENTLDKNMAMLADYLPSYVYDNKKNLMTFIPEKINDKSFDLYRVGNFEKKFVGKVFRNISWPFLRSVYYGTPVNSNLKGEFVFFIYDKNNNYLKLGLYELKNKILSTVDLEVSDNNQYEYPPVNVYETQNYLLIQYIDNNGENIKIKPKDESSKIDNTITNCRIIGGEYQNDIIIVKEPNTENIKVIKVMDSANTKEINRSKLNIKNAYCSVVKNIINMILIPEDLFNGSDSKYIKLKYDYSKNKISDQELIEMDRSFYFKSIVVEPELDKLSALVKENGKLEIGVLNLPFTNDEAYYSKIDRRLNTNTIIEVPFKAYTNYIYWWETNTDPISNKENKIWFYID